MKRISIFLSRFLIIFLLVNLTFSWFQIDFVPAVKASPGYEDFTDGWTEVDPGQRINFTQYHIDHLSLRKEASYFYKSYGANHFDDFTHFVDVRSDFQTVYGWGAVWMICNATGAVIPLQGAGEAYVLIQMYRDTTTKKLYIREWDGSNLYLSTGRSLDPDTWYYLRIYKDDTTMRCRVWNVSDDRDNNDTGASSYLGEDSLTLQSDYSFEYLIACNTLGTGSNEYPINNDIDNLDLQEEPPEEPENSVELKSPNNGVTVTSWSVDFVFNATFYQTIQNASLHIENTTSVPTAISWTTHHWNTSSVENKTDETITYSFSGNGEGSYKWNVEVFNSTHGVYATSNRTLTVDVPPRYQNVDSNSTSIEEGGSILLYGQGYDGIGLDYSWLWTNETGGTGHNYTEVGQWEEDAANPLFNTDMDAEYSVLKVASEYLLYYGLTSARTQIRVANSSDGKAFTDRGVILTYNTSLDWEEKWIWSPHCIYDSGTYYIFYTGRNNSDYEHICVAQSSNSKSGFTKSPYNPILDPNHEDAETWEDMWACHCWVGHNGSMWTMLYSGGDGAHESIGLATCSNGTFPHGGGEWTRDTADNPVIAYGDSYDLDYAFHPHVVKVETTWYVFYSGNTGGENSICRASGTSLESQTKYSGNPVLEKTGAGWQKDDVANPHFLEYADMDIYAMYYIGMDGTTYKLGLVTSYQITADGRGDKGNPYGSPIDLADIADTWTWTNFTWCNASIGAGTTIQWRIYYNDTYGNENGTAIHSFTVTYAVFTEEFTETITISASFYTWKALFQKYAETITITATSCSWTETVSFFSETISPVANLYVTKELMAVFEQWFQETASPSSILNLWKAKQFTTQETLSITDTFNKWLSLTRYFTETITPSGPLAIFKETLVTIIEFSELIKPLASLTLTHVTPPITLMAVLGIACIGLIIALVALVLVVNKKD